MLVGLWVRIHSLLSLLRVQADVTRQAVPATRGLRDIAPGACARLAAQWVVLQSGGPFLGSLALSNGVDLVLQTQ